jgi:hypothetical protein
MSTDRTGVLRDRTGLPVAFRLFRAGLNSTSQGPVLVDDAALADVMSSYTKRGVDCMIDLQHASVTRSPRIPNGADARGYGRLESVGGELWLTGVRWSPDGEARLRSLRQRYPSPVVFINRKTRRLMQVINVALVSDPGTDHAVPLMLERTMDPKVLQDIREALVAGDAAKALELLDKLLAALPPPEDASGEAAAEPPPAEGAALARERVDLVGKLLAAFSGAPKSKPSLEPAARTLLDSDSARAATTPPEEGALARVLKTALGTDDAASVVGLVRSLQNRLDAVEAERHALDAAERVDLVGKLVTLGYELPATAWSDPSKGLPAKQYQTMPLADLRARVAAFSGSPKSKPSLEPAARTLSDSDSARAATITDAAARARFERIRLQRGAR